MRRYSEILRFHDGARVQASAPEATLATPPRGAPPDAGEQLVILVDLGPGLAHRSRETRTIAAQTYWQSDGGIVARLRRALAEANRYVMQENLHAAQPASAPGSITCAVFHEEELFLGQVGPGNVLLYHPDGEVELFPSRALPMLPLGASLPPAIHIGYAPVSPGSALLLATTSVAEAQARSLWVQTLAADEPQQSIDQVLRSMQENRVTGCAVFVHCLAAPVTAAEAYLASKPTTGARQTPPVASVALAESAAAAESLVTTVAITPPSTVMFTEPLAPAPPLPEAPPKRRPALKRKPPSTPESAAEPPSAPPPPEPATPAEMPPPSMEFATETSEGPRTSLTDSIAARLSRLKRPTFTLPQIPIRRTVGPLLRAFGVALMPGKVAGKRARATRVPPVENSLLLSSLTLGSLLIVIFITITTYFQFGGATRATTLLDDAEAAWNRAYTSQTTEDWRRTLTLAEQILALDSQNSRAQTLRDDARLNLDALENAAVLSLTQITELGVSPAPRRMLVARSWIYLLNPVTNEVTGIPLAEDGLRPNSAALTPILRQGQMIEGVTVEHLVDIAWMTPGPGYPDGAVLIYSDTGSLYIYEPALGPSSITRQQLLGEHIPRAVTMMGAYGDQLYLLDRQQGQLFRYAPINGLYNSPPRPYFAPGSAPQLQTALDLHLDGRLYLLLGDGSVHTFLAGVEDLTFTMQHLPDANLRPALMYVEPHPETGRIYLGDRQSERIVVLDKNGRYLHQFRTREGQLRQLEALAVSQEPRVLYMIAANGVYAATLPEFARR